LAFGEDSGVAFLKRKIGLLGGSFDPIHFGHLNLAIQMLEKGGLDQILFCPALFSPFKSDHRPVASPQHRLSMIKLILEPFFAVTSSEIDRAGPSYTIDTLRSMDQKNSEYRLILSDESAAHFGQWREAEELAKLAPPLVGSRSGGLYGPFQTIQTPLFDVSSTEIRCRLAAKKYCKHFMPSIVLDYIDEHELYLKP
jgi:nicotinate-nucleotide adenylyltransferase